MKVYLDFVFFLNFTFDFLLLLTVTTLLKRNISIKRIILGALVGSLSIVTLFLNMNTLELFLFKVIISIIMSLITFSYKNIKYTLKNLFYLYTSSMMLGGFLYFLNIQFSYANEGMVFYHKGLSINVLFLIIFSPIILYTYIKQSRGLKKNYSKHYKVDIYLKDKIIRVNGFLDTGNQLTDPTTKKPIILVNESCLDNIQTYFFVPIHTINQDSLLKCISIEKIDIKGIGIRNNVVLGISPKNIKMEGIDCILHSILLED